MTSDDLREKVAQAMFNRTLAHRPEYLEIADAALSAIREAGYTIVPVEPNAATIEAWVAMLKAAQEGKPPISSADPASSEPSP